MYLPQEQEDANETKGLVEREGRKCLMIAFDLTNLKSVDKIVKEHMDTFGSLDILVNNASRQIICKNFEDIDLGKFTTLLHS